jgi:Response regulators consisting of a CheY-like receiver domain and a winged-helix DNA-binding domain
MMTPKLKPRVLIVEDDPDLLVVLRVNLTAIGVEPILAGDGAPRSHGSRPNVPTRWCST